ncbi:hypothetical protein NQD34_008435, partial [Periophthalmus magnuspinnatus]
QVALTHLGSSKPLSDRKRVASQFKTRDWRRVVLGFMKMSQNSSDKDDQSPGNKKGISLPISRVRLIMKSSPDVSSINQEALFLTTKATELFVQHLAVTSFNNGSGKETNSLSYSDLANTAEETETFHFLTDILPKKILARDYLQSLEEMKEEDADF